MHCNFVDGKRLGKGEYNFSNGDSYKGDFVNGKRHRKGVYNFSNGEIYKGDFVDGKKGGMGAFLLSSGASVSGFFKKDIFIPDAKKEAKLSLTRPLFPNIQSLPTTSIN